MRSRYVVREVVCDEPGCGEEWEDVGCTVREVDQRIKRLGWVRTADRRDLCPAHANEHPE